MLGVHRPTVTLAELELEKRGLIRHSRAAIEIIDRPGLLASCCECYEMIRLLYDETFKAVPASTSKIESLG